VVSGYIFDFIDVFIREILDHHEGLSWRTEEALKVLDEEKKIDILMILILSTDKGVQFRNREF